jgi:hypothetical protein
MKRWLSAAPSFALFLFLVSVVPVSPKTIGVVQASPETVVKVDPATVSVNVSETFTVDITVVDVQNLYSVEVTLYWNSSLLELEQVDIRVGQSDGVLHNPVSIVENATQNGMYTLSALSSTPAPSFNGTGNVVKLTFKATGSGDSKLDLESQLYDYPPLDRDPRISEPIPHTTIDGFYSGVLPEIPSSIVLMAVLVLATLAVLVLKKVLGKPRHIYCSAVRGGNQRLLVVDMLLRERAGT